MLLQYLDARKVKNLDDIVSLLVSDRVKASLSEQCLKYVLSVENNLPATAQQWLGPQRLAELVDEYVSYTNVSGTRASYIGQVPAAGVEGRPQFHSNSKPVAEKNFGSFPKSENFRNVDTKVPPGQTPRVNSFGRKCSNCRSPYHLRAAFDKVREGVRRVNTATVTQDRPRPGQDNAPSPGGQSAAHVSVNRVELHNRPTGALVLDGCIGLESADATDTTVKPRSDEMFEPLPTYTSDFDVDLLDSNVEGLVSLFDECECPLDDSSDSDVHVTNVQFDMDRFIADSNVSLHYVNLMVNDECGNTVEVDSLFDTGTQLSIIKEHLIGSLQYEVLGEVKLLGFNGNVPTGKVISLYAKLNDCDVSVPVKFVACRHVTQNCLLSLADYRRLLQTQQVRCTTGQTQAIPRKDGGEFCSRDVGIRRGQDDISTADADHVNDLTDDAVVNELSLIHI